MKQNPRKVLVQELVLLRYLLLFENLYNLHRQDSPYSM
jgi:hypothetical protein